MISKWRNWLIYGWKGTCPRCSLDIGEAKEFSFCPNCGKWLGVIRKHVFNFLGIASMLAAVGGGAALSIHFGYESQADPFLWCLAALFLISSGLLVLSIPPVGKWIHRRERCLDRARELNAEKAKAAREGLEVETGTLKKSKPLRDIFEETEWRRKHERLKGMNAIQGTEIIALREENQTLREKLREKCLENEKAKAAVRQRESLLEEFKAKQIPLLLAHRHDLPPLGGITCPDHQRLKEALLVGMHLTYAEKTGEEYDGRIMEISLSPLPATPLITVKKRGVCQNAHVRGADMVVEEEAMVSNVFMDGGTMTKKGKATDPGAIPGGVGPLNWEESVDGLNRPTWEAASPYHDDGTPFYFRIKRKGGSFRLDHDAELMRPGDKAAKFRTLDAAMMACELASSEILISEGLVEEKKVGSNELYAIFQAWKAWRPGCAERGGPGPPSICSKCGESEAKFCEAMARIGRTFGWVPRCRLRFQGPECGARATAFNQSCNKTVSNCEEHGNFERFSP
jgi:hypothetical protein